MDIVRLFSGRSHVRSCQVVSHSLNGRNYRIGKSIVIEYYDSQSHYVFIELQLYAKQNATIKYVSSRDLLCNGAVRVI